MQQTLWIFSMLIAVGTLGCGDGDGGGGDMTGAEQAELGGDLYDVRCAHCHGVDGSGDESLGAPALVGEGVLGGFSTAADVVDFVAENMPGDDPGSLGSQEVLAVVAFALMANGVEPGSDPLTHESAAEIPLGD